MLIQAVLFMLAVVLVFGGHGWWAALFILFAVASGFSVDKRNDERKDRNG